LAILHSPARKLQTVANDGHFQGEPIANATLSLKRATLPADNAALSDLMLGYFEDLIQRFPEQRDNITQKYDSAKMPDLMALFAQLHSRPEGDLRIAWLDDQPVGCAMLRPASPNCNAFTCAPKVAVMA
jgi:hypothetical protein